MRLKDEKLLKLFYNVRVFPKEKFAHRVLLCILLYSLMMCMGCKKGPEKVFAFLPQQFCGRDELISYGQVVRRPVYQAKVPLQWQRIDPPAKESNVDTTKPIVSFQLDGKIILTVHSFPSNTIEERIPIAAQVERWRTQLKSGTVHVEPTGHSGYVGAYFEGKCDTLTILAWSLQLDFEHYQTLHFLASSLEEEEHYRQMAADLTIKVSGPSDLIEKHRGEISLFANSFELIQAIPMRLG